jgi:cysteine synthase B
MEFVDTEEAYRLARDVARCEGLLLGPSAAAAIVAALRVARELDQGVIVAILPDSGLKYLSTPLWHPERG